MQSQSLYSPFSSAVATDARPRSSSYSFNGADVSWHHPKSQSERERLDSLLGLALIDPGVRERLLVDHDSTLLDDFDLSEDTREWITSVEASTLKELAQAIVAESVPFHGRAVSRAH